jgi:tetratricopeptide (TPR) repeat protein
MIDPLRTDRLPTSGDVPERERDARVEDLLLIGLDHYFLGQHELAISVWTRVLFLDRGHARARAYIERARGAIAERQREGEELLHTGAEAFDRGDAPEARKLLTSAVERGAASEEAVALLERLDRLENATASGQGSAPRNAATTSLLETGSHPSHPVGSSRVAWIASGVCAGVAIAAVGAWLWTGADGWWRPRDPAPAPTTVQPRPDRLPVPSSAEASYTRAERLHRSGRLHDALDVLDGIRHGDPMRPRADALRAEIQRQLLDSVRAMQTAIAQPEGQTSRPPVR